MHDGDGHGNGENGGRDCSSKSDTGGKIGVWRSRQRQRQRQRESGGNYNRGGTKRLTSALADSGIC
ncbi:hypothetical protein CRG98_019758 [Punica granatum]|uniref:Uncharacterized protein n=1 Tax=Punica granatum TaxID=22663 RepID=A0A2I0JWP3_PUNGR|nr:hypothetical protein CRG98_019758 [Punica granatum]